MNLRPKDCSTIAQDWWPAVGAPLERGVRRRRVVHMPCRQLHEPFTCLPMRLVLHHSSICGQRSRS